MHERIFYDWHPGTNAIRFSGNIEGILGVAPAELRSELAAWIELIHPDDRAAFAAGLQRVVETHGVFELQYRMRRKDGRIIYVEATGQFVREDDGAVRRMVGFVRDITQRKQDELALREAEHQLRENASFVADILNSLPAHVLVVDEHGTIINANEAWRAFARQAPALARGVLGENFFQICGTILQTRQPEPVAAVSDGVRAVIAGVRPSFALDYQAEAAPRAAWYTLRISPLGGGRRGAVLAHEDVTERKEAALEVQRQARFAQYNPNPVLELTPAGEIGFANHATDEMMRAFGFADARELLPDGYGAILRDCLATGRTRLRLETQPKGRTISWSFFPIATANVVHCYGGDITERKRLEEELRQAHKMEAVGKLSGGIAHDFNNLLTVIHAHVGLIQALPDLSPETNNSLAGIAEATDRASNLTRQLLTFSRKQPMRLRAVDLNEVVRNLANLLGRIFGEDAKIEFHYAAQPQPVLADTGMLEQVLMNLAVNARDAMPRGGRLQIRVDRVSPPPGAAPNGHNGHAAAPAGVTGRTARPGAQGHVRITVTDTGAGIAPEVLPHIFDPFFTTKEVGKGTGLGLATVYSIVQQHEGWIDVRSAVGQGTTFEIFLPRSAAPAEPVVERPRRAASGGTETILVVEDEELVRTLVVKVLTRQGYTVLPAANGLEALRIWGEHRAQVRLLLTDLIMPGALGGKDLATQLTIEDPNLRVVYMTGYSREVAGNNALLREDVNFLPKPFDPERLVKIVRARLDDVATRSPFAR